MQASGFLAAVGLDAVWSRLLIEMDPGHVPLPPVDGAEPEPEPESTAKPPWSADERSWDQRFSEDFELDLASLYAKPPHGQRLRSLRRGTPAIPTRIRTTSRTREFAQCLCRAGLPPAATVAVATAA